MQASRPCVAERVGFEPTVPFRTTVFETVRFGRSRTSPRKVGQRRAAYRGRLRDSNEIMCLEMIFFRHEGTPMSGEKVIPFCNAFIPP